MPRGNEWRPKTGGGKPLKFYNVKTRRAVMLTPSEEVKRGKTIFYTAKDPKTGMKLWRIARRG